MQIYNQTLRKYVKTTRANAPHYIDMRALHRAVMHGAGEKQLAKLGEVSRRHRVTAPPPKRKASTAIDKTYRIIKDARALELADRALTASLACMAAAREAARNE